MLEKNSSMHTWAPAACITCAASSMLACSSSTSSCTRKVQAGIDQRRGTGPATRRFSV